MRFNSKLLCCAAFGTAIGAALVVKWLRMPKPRVFDTARRTDPSGKMRTESSFAFLNRSAQPGSAASRELIEAWLSHVPAAEHADFCARFRCGVETEFISALQELTLHELLRCQGCKLRFHPNINGTTKQPDFSVSQPGGSAFLLEACTSTKISSGPDGGPRADSIRDFLQGLDLPGYLIGIDELAEGSSAPSQKRLAKHIDAGIKAAAEGYSPESISIPLFSTNDGWRIKLTAFPTDRYGTRRGTVMQEAWSRSWNGPSYPLQGPLNKKGGRYGSELDRPYVIAVNSSDPMLIDRHFEETLFGTRPQVGGVGSPQVRGFWGTATDPVYRRVSAVLFTKNLWPATLLMGQVDCRLYLNPWANRPYDGVLTKLPTSKLENDVLQSRPGASLHELLRLRLRDSALWA
jgi:hypothetical protein